MIDKTNQEQEIAPAAPEGAAAETGKKGGPPPGTARHLALFAGLYIFYVLALYLPPLRDLPQAARAAAPAAVAAGLGFAGRFFGKPALRDAWKWAVPLAAVSISGMWYGTRLGQYGPSLSQAPLMAASAVLVALTEEVCFRGELLSAIGKTPEGIAVSSAVFGISHLFNLLGGARLSSVAMQVWYAAAIGILLGCAAAKTGSLWMPILFHALFNFLSGYSNTFNYVLTTRVAVNLSLTLVCLYAFAVCFPDARERLAARLGRRDAAASPGAGAPGEAAGAAPRGDAPEERLSTQKEGE